MAKVPLKGSARAAVPGARELAPADATGLGSPRGDTLAGIL
jgi:hypothetical protein